MQRIIYTAMLGLVIPVLWSGCSGTDAPPAANPPDVATTVSISGAPAGVSISPANGGEDADIADATEPQSQAITASPTAPTFDPPFPDRVELFAIPNRQSPLEKQGRSNGNEQSIELKGFVNVGKRRAVLAINGVTSPIAEGETRYGVEVVSIEPPRVVLQRGRSRWTTTLAN